ncbi:hypothetical protein PENSUB_11113 [Penicillium subrubescens]|uniref:Uncharacterized protein n=1 Tax=Penicillium subrubescens TaxID=1316194 RepID=A0A1Q5T5U9_9EURO|nr:hypothetical protein PENSUB_11113 [Penicillium subrubescens]
MKDILVVLDILQLSFGGFFEYGLVVDDVLQLVDELLPFPGGDPARVLPRYITPIMLSSLSCDSRWDVVHPKLEILD